MLSGDDLVDTLPIPEFPPHVLREYAFLADGERGILVGPRGDLAWMCFPHWDSAAIFSSLIGGSGVYAITPKERSVWGGFYEEGSLIWHGRWVTDTRSVIECREALALPSERDRAVLLRHVTALEGTARVQMIFNPRGDFGQAPFRNLHLDERGVWSGQIDEIEVHLSGAAEATPRPDGHRGTALVLDFELAEGTNRDFVLTIGQRQLERPTPDSDVAWSETEAAWQERVPQFTDIYARRDARQAYALLSGLTSQSGGMVAAATMSLPERATEGRNYDYRYVWIRDQCYAGQAVAATGAHPLLDSAVKFVSERLLEHGPGLKPVYRTSGESTPGERHLGLPGYPGGDDIVGNNARNQFQLDAFGESLLLLAAAARHDRLEPDSWRAATIAARAIEERWREPDAGIWELEPDEWTHSRLICAAGLRAISAHAQAGERVMDWLALAERITADASSRSVHPTGRWQRSPSDARLDAALLLPAIRKAIPADDPRSLATVRAFAVELTQDGYAYRYQPDERPLGEAEGAFLLCGFILSRAYLEEGNAIESARWFERTRSACGSPGLFAEEFDVTQHQLRGNLPQAFVHAWLLECAAVQHTTPDQRSPRSSRAH